VTSLRRDDYQIPNDPDAEAAGVRDVERERDAVLNFPGVTLSRPDCCSWSQCNRKLERILSIHD
jgi:hypothetical protein